MTETSLWNFEGMTEILTEGPIGFEWTWLYSLTVEITEISFVSESVDFARMKAV